MLIGLHGYCASVLLAAFSGVYLTEEMGLLNTRILGVVVTVIGVLIFCSAGAHELRPWILPAACVTKGIMVPIYLVNFRKPIEKGFRPVAAFDNFCVVSYTLYLNGWA